MLRCVLKRLLLKRARLQHWNHSFFWQCMKPGGGGAPPSALEDALKSSFGSVDAFKAQFKDAAVAQFGSGWAWLVHDADDKLKIVKTPNAESPLCYGQVALLTCDVWEHAYCAQRAVLSGCSVLGRPRLTRCACCRPGLPESARRLRADFPRPSNFVGFC
jgi:hypothetical protein